MNGTYFIPHVNLKANKECFQPNTAKVYKNVKAQLQNETFRIKKKEKVRIN